MLRRAGGERGTALITALIMLSVMSMFLVGFESINQSELTFAGYSRESTLAFATAEAGIQESIKRLNIYGATPGTTCFVNSTTTGASCGTSTTSPNANTVVYQAPLLTDSAIFPILSTATAYGATRAVRVFMRAVLKTGFGDTIIGPQVTFQGDASPVTGDTYSDTSIVFPSAAKSPAPGSGATSTNLTGPQIMGGTTIDEGSGGAEVGPFAYECGNNSTSEVAPTACTGQGGRAVDGNGNTIPVNWHPDTPLGMSTADFTSVVSHCYPSCSGSGYTISVVQATQSGTGVTYTPVSYTPSYWTSTGSNKVMLVVATSPFCVTTGGTIVAPSGGSCGSGHYYAPGTSPTQPMRFLDWGLVQDDLTRNSATTFFQPPLCTAPCADQGLRNGVRYIPLLPSLSVTALACQQNVNPGTNVFDQVNGADGIACNNPISTISSTNVTFSGTKSSPESLVIDNAGQGTVHINGSISGSSTLTCSNTNFDNYNFGLIFATGDIDIAANTVFTGFIYTPGNVYSHGTVVIQGGVFSVNDPASGTQVNQVDDLGTVIFCGGSSTQVIINPQFYTFSVVSWQDRPSGQP